MKGNMNVKYSNPETKIPEKNISQRANPEVRLE